MKIQSKHIENAVEQFASLPSIGKRTALRLALHLLNREKEEVEKFAQTFVDMKTNIHKCQSCGNISDTAICEICSNPSRDHQTICVVENIQDIMAIEDTLSYRGIYHVLGGVISPMDGIGPRDLNIETLVQKVREQEIHEIILAVNATMEGDTTCYYLYKKLSEFELTITTLSRGVSVGTEIQYADELTLERSIVHRTPYKVTV